MFHQWIGALMYHFTSEKIVTVQKKKNVVQLKFDKIRQPDLMFIGKMDSLNFLTLWNVFQYSILFDTSLVSVFFWVLSSQIFFRPIKVQRLHQYLHRESSTCSGSGYAAAFDYLNFRRVVRASKVVRLAVNVIRCNIKA